MIVQLKSLVSGWSIVYVRCTQNVGSHNIKQVIRRRRSARLTHLHSELASLGAGFPLLLILYIEFSGILMNY